MKFYPFLNEAEWLAHKALLAGLELPNYDDWRQKNAIETSRIQSALSTGFLWLPIICMMAFMLAGSLLLWPLHVLVFTFAGFLPERKAKQGSP